MIKNASSALLPICGDSLRRNGLSFDLHKRLYNIQPRRAWEAYRLLCLERGRADRGSATDRETRSFGKSFKFTLSVGGFKDLPKLRVLVSLMALRRSAPTAPSEIPEPVRFPCPAGLDIVEPLVQIEEEAVSTEAVSTNGEQGGRLKQIFIEPPRLLMEPPRSQKSR